MRILDKSEGLYGAIPNEIFNAAFNKKYTDELTAIWEDLVKLNSYLLLTEKIVRFRFDLFGDLRNTFWYFITYGMMESSILILFRIVFDTNKNSVTLPRLKNAIAAELRNEEYRKEFIQRIKALSFDKRIKDSREAVIKKRNKLVAHLDSETLGEFFPKSLRSFAGVLAEVKEATVLVNEYFDSLSIGAISGKLPIDYYQKDRIDLDELLESIAKESHLLNMPEREPEYWQFHKKANLTDEQIDLINSYRRKFGRTLV
jgi:hypothetical protein